jgi:hypothetical protein
MLPFTLAQTAYPCGAILHVLTISPHADEWLVGQLGSSHFPGRLRSRVTSFQEGYKVYDLFLCFWWQRCYFANDIRSFHLLDLPSPMAAFAKMQTAPLFSPRPVPMGEKCGAAS